MFACETIQTNDRLLAGFSFTGPFPASFPDEAINVQGLLGSKNAEFAETVDKGVMFSPYTSVDGTATYWACYEVQEGDAIPEGATRFTVPGQRYAKVACTNKTIGEGYGKVFDWMGQNGYKQLGGVFSMEIFYLKDGDGMTEPVDILIPIEG